MTDDRGPSVLLHHVVPDHGQCALHRGHERRPSPGPEVRPKAVVLHRIECVSKCPGLKELRENIGVDRDLVGAVPKSSLTKPQVLLVAHLAPIFPGVNGVTHPRDRQCRLPQTFRDRILGFEGTVSCARQGPEVQALLAVVCVKRAVEDIATQRAGRGQPLANKCSGGRDFVVVKRCHTHLRCRTDVLHSSLCSATSYTSTA